MSILIHRKIKDMLIDMCSFVILLYASGPIYFGLSCCKLLKELRFSGFIDKAFL